MRLCVLGANAQFPTGYDSKGYGLMRLAGHTPKHWPVSSRPCDCRTPRPALHRVAWDFGGRLSHAQLWHTQLLHTHTQLFYAQLSHTHTTRSHSYTTIPQLPHTQLLHTQLFHPHTLHLSNTHPQLFHIQLFFNLSILHHLLCVSFLRPASTFVSNFGRG